MNLYPRGRQMETGMLVALIALGITVPLFLVEAGIMYFAVRGLRRAQKQRQDVRDAPLVVIKKLKAGLHKVEGKIRAREQLLRSPLSKKKCVYYQFLVQEEHVTSNGKQTTRTWVSIIDDRKLIDIAIVDKTGEVEINFDEAEVTLTATGAGSSNIFKSPSPEVKVLMRERYGKSTKGLIFNKTLRYRETFLCDGDEIFLVGDVKVRKGRAPLFYKGEHSLMITDLGESEVNTIHTGRTFAYWFAIGGLGLFMLLTCGAGAVISVVGAGAGFAFKGLPNLPGDSPNKLTAKPLPINPAWDDKNMASTFLSDMQEENVKVGHGKFGKNGMLGYGLGLGQKEAAISVAGQAQKKAISFHPPNNGESSVQYRLNKEQKLFLAQVALQDFPAGAERTDSPLTCKILGDGELLWFSDPPLQKKGDSQTVRISVENVNVLELQVHCAGNHGHAWAVWVNPRVLKEK